MFIVVFPVFAVTLVRSLISGAGAQLMGPNNAHRFIRYVLLLPLALELTYAFIICLAVLGFATGIGTAEDVQADESGYYLTYRDKTAQRQHRVRVELTEPEYYEAVKSQLRIFCAVPAMFYAFSSFLVLASASAAAERARSARPVLRSRTGWPEGPAGTCEFAIAQHRGDRPRMGVTPCWGPEQPPPGSRRCPVAGTADGYLVVCTR
ncbi:hypothetical protein ACFVT5_38230 [Streptomyces sp. NPDC058001]|uniref:hypothetical protein n=1 Tax=Streptomyces sp. NPDC058001 TaxID=3346300 RepID=UPI0036F0EE91